MWRVLIAVAAFSFPPPSLSSLLAPPFPFALSLSPPLTVFAGFVGFLLPAMTESTRPLVLRCGVVELQPKDFAGLEGSPARRGSSGNGRPSLELTSEISGLSFRGRAWDVPGLPPTVPGLGFPAQYQLLNVGCLIAKFDRTNFQQLATVTEYKY